jgi:hypothetical protein
MDNKVTQLFASSIKCPTRVGIASFILGAATSAGVSYILNRRKAPVLFHDVPNPIEFDSTELDNTIRKHVQPKIDLSQLYEPVNEEELAVDESNHVQPADLGKDFVEKKMDEPVIIVPEAPVVVEPERRTIFAGSDDEWNLEEELASRSEKEPYIIHADEFAGDEVDYVQSSLVYYVGDAILVDAQETPVYNLHQVVGDLKFGHGSGDPNVVYVRNDKLKAEYEVFKHEGSWSIDVLGLETEDDYQSRDLKHSHHVPRFYKD